MWWIPGSTFRPHPIIACSLLNPPLFSTTPHLYVSTNSMDPLTKVPPFSLHPTTLILERPGAENKGHSFGAHFTLIAICSPSMSVTAPREGVLHLGFALSGVEVSQSPHSLRMLCCLRAWVIQILLLAGALLQVAWPLTASISHVNRFAVF